MPAPSPPVLLVAAHGTRSERGTATTRALVAAVGAARPDLDVALCFLDVAAPSLADALDDLGPRPVVVVPLLLAAGYHVNTDIPRVAAGRPAVRVARHLGPDPLVVDALADRLAEAHADAGATTLLAAVPSSQMAARADVDAAAAALSRRLGRTVRPLLLASGVTVRAYPPPVGIATYLLGEGAFLDQLRGAVGSRGVVAAPIGVHPALVSLVGARYDEAVARW